MGRFAGRDILERSKAFGVMAVRLARHLPADPGSRHIGLQFLRSATSVGANLHEADMADTVKDFCNKVNLAQKEAGEATYWIGLLDASNIGPTGRLTKIQAQSVELRKICRQIVLSTRRKTKD